MTNTTINPLEQVLINTITKVNTGIDKGVDFAYQQIPDIINQLLTFHLIWNSLLASLLILFFIFVGYLNYKQYKWWLKPVSKDSSYTNFDQDGEAAFANLLQLLVLIPMAMALLFYIKDIIYIALAPKLYLIEYVSNLVK